MLKHAFHARLSIWHVVLLVVILALTLPIVSQPVSPGGEAQIKNAQQIQAARNEAALR